MNLFISTQPRCAVTTSQRPNELCDRRIWIRRKREREKLENDRASIIMYREREDVPAWVLPGLSPPLPSLSMEPSLGAQPLYNTSMGAARSCVGTQTKQSNSIQMSFIGMRKHTFTLPKQVSTTIQKKVKNIKTVVGEHIYSWRGTTFCKQSYIPSVLMYMLYTGYRVAAIQKKQSRSNVFSSVYMCSSSGGH